MKVDEMSRVVAEAREKYPEMWAMLRGYVAAAADNPKPDDAQQILALMDALKRDRLSDIVAAMKAMSR